ncbi:hypothetical protein [Limnofasciculus baicalensis]|uniref:DUF4351 domain-containing protein n=1 Tax=Limnofasciculus baicalensis BBK-W-15 TaxID=2699891 RepID=A0AAE3GNL4_9CYAN|nr:hypothetical protein [Limnofasciculus baicalensis]MCP2727885.1 hypothetical protein [Limnofasciculus baicalensis BBK-W-15]
MGLKIMEITCEIFQVIDRMMALPEELQQSFENKLTSYEEERQMPLLSRMEERGLLKGIEQGTRQGLEQGLERGLERGTKKTLQATIIRILQARFEIVPTELINGINSLEDISKLERLVMTSVTMNSIADFGQVLSQLRQATDTNEA